LIAAIIPEKNVGIAKSKIFIEGSGILNVFKIALMCGRHSV
jgi:hypothetical protein